MATDSLSALKNRMFGIGDGKLVISPDNREESASISISNDEIIINSSNISSGIAIDDKGVLIQGDVVFTGYGTSIKKGEYSENPKSSKIFTYTETVSTEADIKEGLSEVVGKLGINTGDLTKDGIMPLLTNLPIQVTVIPSPPHVHKMLFKHVHRIEPEYLYRIPEYIRIFKNFISGFVGFLSS